MKLNNVFEVDERGVSPVIGVILMVAITVILAAVIGAFVLDLGSQLGSTGPTSQLALSDAGNDGSFSGSSPADTLVTVEHKGGDDLKTSDLKVIVESGGTQYTGSDVSVSWGSSFTVGETATISEGATSTGYGIVSSAGTEVTVKIIHEPSNSVVASSKVEVR